MRVLAFFAAAYTPLVSAVTASGLYFRYAEAVFSYTTRDACLYALSVGASEHAPDEKDLPLVYEMAGDGFRTLPTMAVLFPTMGMSQIFNVRSPLRRLALYNPP